MIPYKLHPERNLGVGKRADFLEFSNFAAFSGNVLDVGVGPQRIPTHMEYGSTENVHFVGIDPLVGEQPREFDFVRGLAEFLPFRDRLFDHVLFVTTMDHFIDPRPALKEAKRVMKKNGIISVWIGEKDRNAPQSSVADWYEKLSVPDGAEDRFHYKRLTAQDFLGYYPSLGFMLRNVRR
jgi:ubiquinone/menaquinone biosynthesis C-methylase UbiE